MQRRVALEGPLNFRDLGGYETADGRRVRWGRVFRSDSLRRVSPADVAHLTETVRLATIIDLRADEELARAGGGLLHDEGVAYHQLPLFDRAAHPNALRDMTLQDFYLIALRRAGPRIVRVLDTLAGCCDKAVVFHCAAGKDRTGVLAALMLALLGAGDDEIADDYALSEHAERRYHEWRRSLATDPDEEAGHSSAWLLNPCPREAMLLFLTELREQHGSVEAYVRRTGVTDAQVRALREHLLD